MPKTKAFNLAEIVRHLTYDSDQGKLTTTKAIDSGQRSIKSKSAASTSAQILDQFAKGSYEAAQYYIVVKTGSDSHALNLNVTHDGSSAYYNQFGDVKSSGDLATFSANVATSNVRVYYTPGSSAATINYKVELVDS